MGEASIVSLSASLPKYPLLRIGSDKFRQRNELLPVLADLPQLPKISQLNLSY